jgi:transposase
MTKQSKQYTDEFKAQIAQLRQSGKSMEELSREYRLSQSSIHRWTKQYANSGKFGVKANLTQDEKQLRELQKENKQLRMENDILKQAALIMARK